MNKSVGRPPSEYIDDAPYEKEGEHKRRFVGYVNGIEDLSDNELVERALGLQKPENETIPRKFLQLHTSGYLFKIIEETWSKMVSQGPLQPMGREKVLYSESFVTIMNEINERRLLDKYFQEKEKPREERMLNIDFRDIVTDPKTDAYSRALIEAAERGKRTKFILGPGGRIDWDTPIGTAVAI